MFTKMDVNSGDYTINRKVNFKEDATFKIETINMCFDFAWEMTFGKGGVHRGYRSGGQNRRKNGEKFINTFQGKLAELAVYNEFHRYEIQLSDPDFETYGLGRWDDADFTYNNLNFSIKSTSFFGNLLLLETRDWNVKGKYIPNDKIYDYHIMVRIKPDGKKLMKKHKLMYSDTVKKNYLYDIISSEEWDYEVTGYISNDDLIEVIQSQNIIPQNATLHTHTRMDAENYYVQSGDLKSIDGLIKEIV